MLVKPHSASRSRCAPLIALALALPLGLLGCAGEEGTNDGQVPETGETSSQGADASDDAAGDGASDGDADEGSAAGEAGDPAAMGLPDNFPSDVPIVKGEVLTAQQKGSSSWSVDIKVEGDVCDFIDTQMTDAGYDFGHI